MKEITGDLWQYYGLDRTVVLITTNATRKKASGEIVMGRGCALEAKKKFPGIAKELGDMIEKYGNTVNRLRDGLWSFPVKHNWWEKADLALIGESAFILAGYARQLNHYRFILPRAGTGNGGLNWSEVKPVLSILPNNVKVISPPIQETLLGGK